MYNLELGFHNFAFDIGLADLGCHNLGHADLEFGDHIELGYDLGTGFDLDMDFYLEARTSFAIVHSDLAY